MDEDDQRPPRLLGRLVRSAGLLLLLVVLYALSLGPTVWLVPPRSRVVGGLEKFYTPLLVLAQQTGTAPWLVAYYSWWMELPGGPSNPHIHQLPPQVE